MNDSASLTIADSGNQVINLCNLREERIKRSSLENCKVIYDRCFRYTEVLRQCESHICNDRPLRVSLNVNNYEDLIGDVLQGYELCNIIANFDSIIFHRRRYLDRKREFEKSAIENPKKIFKFFSYKAEIFHELFHDVCEILNFSNNSSRMIIKVFGKLKKDLHSFMDNANQGRLFDPSGQGNCDLALCRIQKMIYLYDKIMKLAGYFYKFFDANILDCGCYKKYFCINRKYISECTISKVADIIDIYEANFEGYKDDLQCMYNSVNGSRKDLIALKHDLEKKKTHKKCHGNNQNEDGDMPSEDVRENGINSRSILEDENREGDDISVEADYMISSIEEFYKDENREGDDISIEAHNMTSFI